MDLGCPFGGAGRTPPSEICASPRLISHGVSRLLTRARIIVKPVLCMSGSMPHGLNAVVDAFILIRHLTIMLRVCLTRCIANSRTHVIS